VLETETRTAASSERAQLIEALIEVAAERGYMDTSIEMVVARAGLDRPAFDRHFRGKYDSFLSAWQEMNEECMASLMRAYDSEQYWPDRLRAVACEVVG
jgi:AcrR family transcriptional regulator